MVGEVVFALTFPGGEIEDEVVLGGSNFSESTTQHKITVPANEEWILVFGSINRDNSSTLNVYLFNAADKRLVRLSNEAAATGWSQIPEAPTGATFADKPEGTPMKVGDYLQFDFGAAQGAVAEINMRFRKIK